MRAGVTLRIILLGCARDRSVFGSRNARAGWPGPGIDPVEQQTKAVEHEVARRTRSQQIRVDISPRMLLWAKGARF